MMDTGAMGEYRVRVFWSTAMVTLSRVSSLMIRQMAMRNSQKSMASPMKAIGRMTSHTGKVSKYWRTVQYMKVNLKMVKSMVMGSINGLIVRCIKGNGSIMNLMGRASTYGVTVVVTWADGKATKCTAMVISTMRTAGRIKDSSKTI